jgi:uncharacterized membrane protein
VDVAVAVVAVVVASRPAAVATSVAAAPRAAGSQTMKIARLIQHRWFDDGHLRRTLNADALRRLEARVAQSERQHSGEIRLCVEAGLPLSYLWRDLRARERAVMLFGKLRVWDTEHNNGVLIYLLLAERAIEVVADRGLMQHVDAAQWQALVDGMRDAFRAGRIEEGLAQAVDKVGALLALHFPLAEGQANPNELPDRVDLR